MSYNIDVIHIIRSKDFTIPIGTMLEESSYGPPEHVEAMDSGVSVGEKGFHILKSLKDEEMVFDYQWGPSIEGRIDQLGNVEITNIDASGGSAGLDFIDYFNSHLVPRSTGEMEILVVWEGGDSVEFYSFINGESFYTDLLSHDYRIIPMATEEIVEEKV